MKVKNYYIPRSDSSIETVEGYVNNNGQLLYQNTFGQSICEKEYFFDSEIDAANELISDIDKQIKELMNKRFHIILEYKK